MNPTVEAKDPGGRWCVIGFVQATASGFEQIAITAGPVRHKKEQTMRKKLTDMNPVDDFVTRNTPGLKIWDEQWGGMQCAYHIFAPGTDFTDILKGKGLEHDLCGVEHWAYVLKGSVEVIYLDGTVEICRAGEVCFWPAPHNFKSKEGAEIIQFSTAGGLAEQGKRVQEFVAKQMKK